VVQTLSLVDVLVSRWSVAHTAALALPSPSVSTSEHPSRVFPPETVVLSHWM
jgi:hypothetical protein